jgi:hypothetical protein
MGLATAHKLYRRSDHPGCYTPIFGGPTSAADIAVGSLVDLTRNQRDDRFVSAFGIVTVPV